MSVGSVFKKQDLGVWKKLGFSVTPVSLDSASSITPRLRYGFRSSLQQRGQTSVDR